MVGVGFLLALQPDCADRSDSIVLLKDMMLESEETSVTKAAATDESAFLKEKAYCWLSLFGLRKFFEHQITTNSV